MLRVRLLGGVALELDGEVLDPPPSRPARALLAWLALHPGAHVRGRLAAQLWPDVMDASARASLRTTLHALRRALGEQGSERLRATRDEVALTGELWVDVRAFDELVAAGRYEEALEVGRGELLAGLEDEWVHEPRERHRDAVAGVLERLAAGAEAEGDLTTALRLTREQIALDPLSEEPHRALIARLARAGDRSAAIAAYERLRERLRAELRVAPSAQTRELAERLREDEAPQPPPPADAAAPALPAVLARPRRSAFVGRAPEVKRLGAVLDAVRPGERRLVAVGGEPGIGKTRLLAEFCSSAHEQGATVLFGRCAEEPLVPYQALDEALRPFAATRAAARPAFSGDADADGARWRLFAAIDALLDAAPGPVVLALDDLQWAQRPELALLAHLVRSPEPGALLVLATHRTGELGRTHPLSALLGDLHRDGLCERIALDGLDRDGVAALMRGWDAPGDRGDLLRTLHAETGGNPFYVEELLRHHADAGAAGTVPESVKDVIARRLARLGEGAVRVLGAAAVAGSEFELGVLEALPALQGDEPLRCVEAAIGAGMLREEPGRPGRYGFAHALIRQTLYEELSAARRARLHGAIARAIEQLHAAAPEAYLGELAHHHLEAVAGTGGGRAVAAAQAAARAASAQLAHEEAARWYERALGALPADAEPAAHAELLLARGEARRRAGEASAAREAFRAAAAIARERADGELLARAALGFSGLAVTIIELDEESVALLREALEATGSEGPRAARLVARLAVETYYFSTPQERLALGDRAVALARRSGDDGALIDALNARHVALWSAGYLDERLQTAGEMIELAERAGDLERAIQGHNWRVLDLAELGDIDAMEREVDRHEQLAETLRLPEYRWWAPMWRSTIALLRGRLTDAEELIEQVAAIGRRAQDANAELYAAIQAHNVVILRENFGDVGDDLLERKTGGPAEAAYRCGYAWLFACQGRIERARELIDWVAADDLARLPDDMNRVPALCELAQAARLLGAVRHARTIYEALAPYAGRNVINARAAGGYGSASMHLGDLAALLGDSGRAASHYEDALAANERMGARPWLAHTQVHFAELLLGCAQPERAAELLDRALETARELGLDALAARARAPRPTAPAA